MKHPLVSRRHGRLSPSCPAREPRREEPSRPDKWRKEGNGATVIAAIREYLSDILGAFMPGVYFSLNLFTSSVLFLFMTKGLTWEDIIRFVTLPQSAVLGAAAPFAVFSFCLFSYIIGSAFCRKDIKEPDTASAIRTYQKSGREERKGLAFNFDKLKGNPYKLPTGLFMRINFRVDSKGVEYPAPWGGSISTSNDSGVETSPVQNEKSPQDFFFSTEDTPLLAAGFFIVSFFIALFYTIFINLSTAVRFKI
jgi:hypothetical protein